MLETGLCNAKGVTQQSYPTTCLIITSNYDLLLLHCQWQIFEGRIFGFKDRGVETVVILSRGTV